MKHLKRLLFFQSPLVWRNFSLKTGRRRWNGSTPVSCWQKSKVGLSGTWQIYHANTALSHVNKSLIPIRHILSMCCIISETGLYSGIKQRPLAALLIHFSVLLSGDGMLDSTERRLKNSNHFRANSEALSACPHFTAVVDGSGSRVSVLAATAIANPNARSL